MHRIPSLALCITLVQALSAVVPAQAQTTWYVNHANCPGPGSGTEGDPFCLIQDGINASVSGDQVVVADGTYIGDGNRNLDFGGRNIHLRSASLDPALCIIDCQGSEANPHRGFYFHNGETAEAEVHGFTITGGNHSIGGGMYCRGGSSPTVDNCTFGGNSATGRGGGMYCSSGSSPTVSNCTFDGNSAPNGGGMYNRSSSSPTVTNCAFSGNSATVAGGGMFNNGSSPTVTDCTFDGNSAPDGGGVFGTNSSPTISNCTFTENSVTDSGGAIYLSASESLIEGCTFTRNTANAGPGGGCGCGGGIFSTSSSPTIENCTFIENEVVGGPPGTGYGGALILLDDTFDILRDCTFVGNIARSGNGHATGVSGAVFHGCHTGVDGQWEESNFEVTNSRFIGNKALGGASPLQATGLNGAYGFFHCSGTMSNCIFAGNSAIGEGFYNGMGGGVSITNESSVELVNCALIGNEAENEGGAVYVGGVHPPVNGELINCTLSGNKAGIGGGVYGDDVQYVAFGNCQSYCELPRTMFVDNSILWNNVPSAIASGSGPNFFEITVGYSDVEGGWLGGDGNIDLDPLFIGGPSGAWSADGVYVPDEGKTTLTDNAAEWVPGALEGMFINADTSQTLQSLIVANDATTVTVWADFSDLGTTGANYQIRDYHVMAGPCIDAADNTAVPSDTTDLDDDGDTDEPIPFDLDGKPRFVDDPGTPDTGNPDGLNPIVDMGAYEFQGPLLANLDIKPGSCPNPFNRHGNGVLPVALVGTVEFDPTEVDLSTLQLSRADGVGGSVAPNEGPPGPHSVFEDVASPFEGEACECHDLGGDGIDDLSMKFRTDELVEALELDTMPGGAVVELALSGSLLDGTPFVAGDCIVIVPPGDLGPISATVGSNVGDTFIEVTPLDLNIDSDGFTGFGRAYYPGTLLTVTAPPSSEGRRFVRWMVDGVLQEIGVRTLEVAVAEGATLQALYRGQRRLRPDRPTESDEPLD